MNSYRFYARSYYPRYALWGGAPSLSTDALAQSVAGVIVREIVETNDGGYVVDVQLQRNAHEDALNEIFAVAEQAGFQIVEATVTEWVTSWIEGLLFGAGGGTIVGAELRQDAGALIGLFVGAAVGAIGGALKPKIKAQYHAQRNILVQGGWLLTPIQPEPPAAPALPWAPA